MLEPVLQPVLAQQILARYTRFLSASASGAELLHPAPEGAQETHYGAQVRNIYHIAQYITENNVTNLQMNLRFAGRLLADAVQAAGKAYAAAPQMLQKGRAGRGLETAGRPGGAAALLPAGQQPAPAAGNGAGRPFATSAAPLEKLPAPSAQMLQTPFAGQAGSTKQMGAVGPMAPAAQIGFERQTGSAAQRPSAVHRAGDASDAASALGQQPSPVVPPQRTHPGERTAAPSDAHLLQVAKALFATGSEETATRFKALLSARPGLLAGQTANVAGIPALSEMQTDGPRQVAETAGRVREPAEGHEMHGGHAPQKRTMLRAAEPRGEASPTAASQTTTSQAAEPRTTQRLSLTPRASDASTPGTPRQEAALPRRALPHYGQTSFALSVTEAPALARRAQAPEAQRETDMARQAQKETAAVPGQAAVRAMPAQPAETILAHAAANAERPGRASSAAVEQAAPPARIAPAREGRPDAAARRDGLEAGTPAPSAQTENGFAKAVRSKITPPALPPEQTAVLTHSAPAVQRETASREAPARETRSPHTNAVPGTSAGESRNAGDDGSTRQPGVPQPPLARPVSPQPIFRQPAQTLLPIAQEPATQAIQPNAAPSAPHQSGGAGAAWGAPAFSQPFGRASAAAARMLFPDALRQTSARDENSTLHTAAPSGHPADVSGPAAFAAALLQKSPIRSKADAAVGQGAARVLPTELSHGTAGVPGGEQPAPRRADLAAPAMVHRAAAVQETAPAERDTQDGPDDIQTVRTVTRRARTEKSEVLIPEQAKRTAVSAVSDVSPEVVEALTEKVYKSIEKRLKTEKMRRGM